MINKLIIIKHIKSTRALIVNKIFEIKIISKDTNIKIGKIG